MMSRTIFFLAVATCAFGQNSITLKEAIQEALRAHPSQAVTAAGVRQAQARVEQARSGYHPKASYTEFFQTSNQPVFAFGTLLNQRRFTAGDLALDALNSPEFTNNFQTQAIVEQTLWDFGATRTAVRAAEIGREISEEQRRMGSQQRIAAVARAYHAVTLMREAQQVARAAVQSAEADLVRAEAVRDAGLSTEADVLSVRVHLASMREQEIRRRYDAEVALAALNEAMGASLDMPRQLVTPLAAATVSNGEGGQRSEVRQARLGREWSEAQRESAGKAFLPQIVARGVFEADRGRFLTRAGANWFFAAGLRWNLFDGSTRRKVEEADAAIEAARAREQQVAAAVSLEQRQARAGLAAAGERLTVAGAAVAEAEESARIVRNRYEAGLARIDELLRNEVAVLETRMRWLQAVYDQRMAALEVVIAAGTLTEDSDVLN
jgi:outer membrane protein TolC